MENGYPLPPAKQQLIQLLIADGLSVQSIVEETGCSRSLVFKYKRNLQDHGSCLAPRVGRTEKPPTVTDAMIEVQTVV